MLAIATPTATWGVSSIVRVMLYNWFMLVNLGIAIFGVLIFLFIFWKRLKEDYASEIVFRSGLSILLGLFVGYFLSIRFFPTWFFWASLLGGILGLTLAVLTLRVRVYETLDALVASSLPLITLVFLKDSIASSSFSSFLGFLASLSVIFLFYYMDLHYKEFTWYKSGKIGFTGLATLGIIFLIRSTLAIFKISVLSFVDKYEAILAGGAAFICFLLVFNLSKRKA